MSSTAAISRATGASSTVSIPGTAAAGGLTMTQPPSTAAASFYKIASADYVTFGWNLTSLYVTPTSLTVVASCSANGNTYPVGPLTTNNGVTSINNVLPGSATQVVWNPYQYEQLAGANAFDVASYTLRVWDERGPTAAVAGGKFSPYSGTQFALYRPQAYTPLASWNCASCSAATSLAAANTGIIAAVFSLSIMVVSGWGLLKRH